MLQCDNKTSYAFRFPEFDNTVSAGSYQSIETSACVSRDLK